MFGINIKYGDTRDTFISVGSLANATEKAIDLCIDLLGYYVGFDQVDRFFIKEHPTSTITSPSHYCITKLNTYKIFHHYKKDNGYIFKTHAYDKICSIKVVYIGSTEIVKYCMVDYDGVRASITKMIIDYITADINNMLGVGTVNPSNTE